MISLFGLHGGSKMNPFQAPACLHVAVHAKEMQLDLREIKERHNALGVSPVDEVSGKVTTPGWSFHSPMKHKNQSTITQMKQV